MKKSIILLFAAMLIGTQISSGQNLLNNLKDKAKDKVNDRANNKVDKTMDKGLDKTENGLDNATKGNKDKDKKNNSDNNNNSSNNNSDNSNSNNNSNNSNSNNSNSNSNNSNNNNSNNSNTNTTDPTRGAVMSNNANTTTTPLVRGKNFLFIVSVNDYKYWPKLNNAAKDGNDVKTLLTSRYEFDAANVSEIYNTDVTIKNITDKLMQLNTVVGANDNLLIYYSGHGFYNKTLDEGYWVPVDGKKGDETTYLPNSTLLKYLKAFQCRHIFLVADACFSGALFSQGSRGYVENVEQYKSRWALTSGRLEAVSDGSSGTNSPFASYFMKFLRDNNKKEVAVSEIIQYVKTSVANNSEQTPVGSPLKNVGDEGGEFIFRLK
ncbi:MAG: hypothetical protein V2A54_04215 [Bacteroidota bacterium]